MTPRPLGLPEGYGVVEGADGLDAGHRSLWGETRFDEGPWVEHAQKPVDYDLGTELSESKNENSSSTAGLLQLQINSPPVQEGRRTARM